MDCFISRQSDDQFPFPGDTDNMDWVAATGGLTPAQPSGSGGLFSGVSGQAPGTGQSQDAGKTAPSGAPDVKTEETKTVSPFTACYRDHTERNGDPVAGVAQRKQQALDNAADGGGAGVALMAARPVSTQATNTATMGNAAQQSASAQGGQSSASAGQAAFGTPARPNGASPPTVRRGSSIGGQDEDGPMDRSNVGFQEDRTDQVRGRNWRYLTEEEKQALSPYFKGELLNDIKLHVGERSWMQPKEGAITLEDHIYWVDGNQPDLNNIDDVKLLVHEIQHSKQFREGLTRGGYVWESIKQAVRNGSLKAGYTENWNEINASQAESEVDKAWGQGNP